MPSFQLSYPSPVKGTKIGSINALTRREKEVEPLSGDVVDMRGRRIMLEAHCSLQGAAHAAMPSTQPRVLSSNDGLLLHSHRRQVFSLRSAPPLASSPQGMRRSWPRTLKRALMSQRLSQTMSQRLRQMMTASQAGRVLFPLRGIAMQPALGACHPSLCPLR